MKMQFVEIKKKKRKKKRDEADTVDNLSASVSVPFFNLYKDHVIGNITCQQTSMLPRF